MRNILTEIDSCTWYGTIEYDNEYKSFDKVNEIISCTQEIK